jgi:uncharacterized protein (TIGR02594 family)
MSDKYKMKNIYTYFILIFTLTGCFHAQATENNRVEVTSDNPVASAVPYLGYSEKTHRSELKELLDIDPVRTEWCAAFVNAVLEESNITSNSNHKYPLTARAFLDWGESVPKDDIQPGDIVVFPRGNQGWQGHVGFYLRTEEINGIAYYWILGGNQRNKVSVVRYKQSSVLGIRRSQISVDNRDKMSYNNRVLGNLLRR